MILRNDSASRGGLRPTISAHAILCGNNCRALDVLPLKPSRSEGRGRGRAGGQPSRHKPASAKPASAPRAPRESRSPKRQRLAAPSEETADVDEQAAHAQDSRRSGKGRGNRGRGRGRGKAAAAAAEDEGDGDGEGREIGDAEEDVSGKGRGVIRGRGGRRGGKGRERGRGQSRDSLEEDAVVLSLNDEPAKQEAMERTLSEQQRKRKGDMEYENQLAMALQVGLLDKLYLANSFLCTVHFCRTCKIGALIC